MTPPTADSAVTLAPTLQAGGDETPVAEVLSWTNGSYSRNYRLRWLKDVPEGTQLFTRPTPAAAADLHQQRAPTVPLRTYTVADHHAALQRIGSALGLLPGADLHRECVHAIEKLKAEAQGIQFCPRCYSPQRDMHPSDSNGTAWICNDPWHREAAAAEEHQQSHSDHLAAPRAGQDFRDGLALSALTRLERAVDMHLGRSAWTQTKHLKGLGYSEAVRKELFAAHDEARAALRGEQK